MTQDPNGGYYGPFAPPQQPEVETPAGHGDPNPPSGGYSVETQDLVNAGTAWDGVSSALKEAWGLTQDGWSYPGLFGMHDTLFISGRLHMLTNRVVVNACADGSAITADRHGCLRRVEDPHRHRLLRGRPQHQQGRRLGRDPVPAGRARARGRPVAGVHRPGPRHDQPAVAAGLSSA